MVTVHQLTAYSGIYVHGVVSIKINISWSPLIKGFDSCFLSSFRTMFDFQSQYFSPGPTQDWFVALCLVVARKAMCELFKHFIPCPLHPQKLLMCENPCPSRTRGDKAEAQNVKVHGSAAFEVIRRVSQRLQRYKIYWLPKGFEHWSTEQRTSVTPHFRPPTIEPVCRSVVPVIKGRTLLQCK